MIILTTLAVAIVAVYVGKILLASNQNNEMRPIKIRPDDNRPLDARHQRRR
ncbi:hypothetical protein [Neptunomonas japonica]|uniref:hypothetical protein n=1 Tax=Neptunomonas japonica TaxID=417574 RepID=UPI0004270A45|nr:hypothetical protein [Neptunomonas japonica]